MSDANCCGVLNINGANLSSEWDCVSCHSNEVSVDVEDTPRYDRALHVIRTVNDDWFEYDLTEEEANDFAHWYDNVPSDDLKAYYVFDKDFNIGPFKSRKDHIG